MKRLLIVAGATACGLLLAALWLTPISLAAHLAVTGVALLFITLMTALAAAEMEAL